MAGISAGWTLLLETPRYLPPSPTVSRKQSSGLSLMLTSEVFKPYSLHLVDVLDDDHQVLVFWGLLYHSSSVPPTLR